ncbi:hybrid sensor histidine kinase/response regulator [Serratia oryzae]|uniref:hybrid sensor histidine kinase/response regulator n=1 Tax=Serratia oryzae TaxID=2034155 RepID=UPI0012E118CB|nr:hybrid sensor histidine kinase/response regulator [Serratia oryzae]
MINILSDKAPQGIKPHSQLRLLNNVLARLVFSINAVPFVGIVFAIWLYKLQLPLTPIICWIVLYLIAAVLVRIWHYRYRQKLSTTADTAMLAQWLPWVNRVALLHGIGLSSLMIVTAMSQSFDFTLLLNISIAAIIAANATHLTPLLGAFQRFFISCWGMLVILLPWRYGEIWPITFLLNLLYAFAIYRHALTSHAFFLQQVRLEEDSILLAEKFRVAKEEAEQALHDKNLFLTTASHDLRQPIHAMGFLIAAIVHKNRDPLLNPQLHDLQESVRSLHLMFNSLLDLTIIENNAVNVPATEVELVPLIDSIVTLFREEANNRGLTLRARFPQRRCVALGDLSLLKQSLINLAHNALRYTPKGGVLLSVRPRGKEWLIEVWDTGIGVADAEKSQIFSPFYRPELAWRIDSAGHGLGLAVVARCAKLMKVQCGMSSIEGKGSRFWMRLPASDTVTARAPLAVPQKSLSAPHRMLTGTCLVVDDDPLVTAAWASLMQAWGVTVRCVASANEAFTLLESSFSPQAILCDQRLRSGESGFDILQELLHRFPQACGAMVSGEFNSEILQQAEKEGYLVLSKPLEPSQLHALLSQWLSSEQNQ